MEHIRKVMEKMNGKISGTSGENDVVHVFFLNSLCFKGCWETLQENNVLNLQTIRVIAGSPAFFFGDQVMK